MKFHVLTLGLLASLAQAKPSRRSTIQKRASITDVGTGFASLNGGTTGGGSATPVTVSDYAGLVAAVAGVEPKVVIITGPIEHSGEPVNIGSHTTLVGADSSVVLTGFGLLIRENKNVIVRNIAVAKVPATNGDAVGMQYAENVWLDHMDLSGDMNSEKDFYDGLCDITRKSSYVTLSNSYIHNHWKGSLIGHSDDNAAEDTGFLKVTQNNNYWQNVGSRTPSLRFGQAHIYNSYFEATDDGINVRQGAQVLVESNVFDGTEKPLYSVDQGGAVESDNVWGAGENTVPAGTLTTVEYPYELLGSGSVIASVVGTAGNTLTFATDGTVTGAPPRKGNETDTYAPPGGYTPVTPPPEYPEGNVPTTLVTSAAPAKTEPPTEGYEPTPPKTEEGKKEKPPVPQSSTYQPTPKPVEAKKEAPVPETTTYDATPMPVY
ncbi:hypothetical protein MBM_07276 [Drepanopeziza brunnea f. sp. 'multigermtubi' MB_m1]|uniref:pectate lyase n=1 Tax=Marssonina brunnea f. sp. multigermtubi (strain MB_m1) TaxID=1072389 RepID=K1WB70_MARBU|nr:uncharacterized protein MBM_07276 [Drepanopeziza brunnea f. sp. 'multigermtubi' MB_m1]EKD14555.1 hypothetical protein MBM_07276 [Drepanopeziza brunnea f. sp. 'multigermtubi' MB_m1]